MIRSGNGSSSNHNNYTITARDLLQANATIIAGVLILLTLTTSFSSSFGRPFYYIDALVVIGGTTPFIASSILIVEEYENKGRWFRLAKRITGYGLIFLVVTIVYFLSVSQQTPVTDDTYVVFP
jgi:hypothetical protein